VEDSARALRLAAAAYRRKLAPKIVAVTGSAGKSTVKEMTARILAARYRTARTRGNWNNEIGLPLSLLAMEGGTEVGVFEVGTNHPGETGRLCAIARPDWGVVTNVGPVHIEFFDTVEAVAREKADLLRSLPPEGVAVLNRDMPHFDLFRAAAPGRVITVSTRADADYVAAYAEDGVLGVRETAGGGELRVRLGQPGAHHALNALLAVAVARGLGVGPDAIVEALERYAPLPMRWERDEVRGVLVINDAYNANPLSMRAALEAFTREPARGRKWLVLAGMLELGRHASEEHLAVGALTARGPWAGLIAIGPLGRLIAEGAAAGGLARARITCCGSNREAAAALARQAAAGDAVLVKGSRAMHLEEIVEIFKACGEG
jgi:UDP-N-acetylmuramoyl-tripeptide--D-alanyl-D-alanine ligase